MWNKARLCSTEYIQPAVSEALLAGRKNLVNHTQSLWPSEHTLWSGEPISRSSARINLRTTNEINALAESSTLTSSRGVDKRCYRLPPHQSDSETCGPGAAYPGRPFSRDCLSEKRQEQNLVISLLGCTAFLYHDKVRAILLE